MMHMCMCTKLVPHIPCAVYHAFLLQEPGSVDVVTPCARMHKQLRILFRHSDHVAGTWLHGCADTMRTHARAFTHFIPTMLQEPGSMDVLNKEIIPWLSSRTQNGK